MNFYVTNAIGLRVRIVLVDLRPKEAGYRVHLMFPDRQHVDEDGKPVRFEGRRMYDAVIGPQGLKNNFFIAEIQDGLFMEVYDHLGCICESVEDADGSVRIIIGTLMQ
jgi:hypothetical protein